MITDRHFTRPVVREHYLRPLSSFPPLAAQPAWLVIDTNVALHQMDLLSSSALPLPLLVAQTVLDEVRHRSLPLYNRLKTLCEEDAEPGAPFDGKRGTVVWNEAAEELCLQREEGESPNDRNDRSKPSQHHPTLSPPPG